MESAGVEFGRENAEFIKQLKNNTGVFSAFKAHAETAEIAKLLINEDGKLRSFSEFKKEALLKSEEYNVRHLKTEYNTAVRSSRMAANFKQFEKTAHIYPNLEWVPSRAAHPRESHRVLWGTIRPINDHFWATIPPVGWGCMCSIKATKEAVTDIPSNAPVIPDEFKNNPAQTGMLFNDKHPYIKDASPETTTNVDNFINNNK